MVNVAGQIKIAAPPEKVRQVFLDFARYPEWAQAHIKSIEVSSRKEEGKLQDGDKLKVVLSGMTFSPEVNVRTLARDTVVLTQALIQLLLYQTNTDSEFAWTGALPLNLFNGRHTFRFEPSQKTPGHTTFHDSEMFGGLLTNMMSVMPSMRGEQTSKNFDAFDQELKKRVESLHGVSGA